MEDKKESPFFPEKGFCHFHLAYLGFLLCSFDLIMSI